MADGNVHRALRILTYALQFTLVVILGYSFVTGETRIIVNVGLMIPIAAFPLLVRVWYDRPLHPVLALWIVLAAFLHAVGALGPYRTLDWYDQFAHGVSGALVAGVGYALVRTIETNYDTVDIPSNLRFVFIVVFTVSFGVCWEVAEFTVEQLADGGGEDPMLVQFGLDDTVWDLVSDLVGGLVVAIWGTGYFDGLRSILGRYIDGTDKEYAGGTGRKHADRTDKRYSDTTDQEYLDGTDQEVDGADSDAEQPQ